ncbi:hypothetical protein PHYSODRAFT_337634 [Phytophthora sojae]|uniref:Uncharacterized protein n=1 Tax=Phytophthora sojae (strain P6497) TaxID=1094619 RepID=G5A1R5_PHYSP|nr:hypothetical protein PHYSODRAFT_337634 [Phytophthora sojae]EGZ10863.1 hypothetical protein PHYSODRAFT_337634 [Phytophthora sojae]|eukprot:XP_009533608.1 hypothetical protein PHYSODRAFT_337634 [Phytophthora sojae]
MARRHDVDADDIDLEDEELDTDDLEAAGCVVCALGAHRPRLPVAPQVPVPAPGAPVHSVTALVADAHTLQRENQALRAQYEFVSAHNAGLATCCTTGYRADMIQLEQALLSREHAEQDYAVLEVRVADFCARAERADAAEALLRAERGSSTEQYRDLQAQLRAAQDQITRARSCYADSDYRGRDDARAERDDLRVDLAAAQAALAPVQARVAAAEAERDQVRQLVATAEQQRDAALAERDRVTRVLVVVEQERDGAFDMRDQARRASTALRREDQARQALTTLELQRAPNLNVPLQDDLRRVNALLVAHAEELRRGATRIHELEESVATATTLRLAAESEMARAQACELCASSRAAQYRSGWLSMRQSPQQRRGAVGVQTHRLSAHVVELEEERDLAIRERAVAWRRMLRDARRGRELARRVRDELADRLAGVVTRVGGQIDTADLVRRLEATFTAEISAVPVASAVPAPASTASGSGARAGSPAWTASSTTGASPPAGPPGSRPVPTSSSSSGFRRPRHSALCHSGSQSRASRLSGVASATSSNSSPLRRSQRPSTVADTAASDNAAAQVSSAATPSAAAATAARTRGDASLFGSESSDSEGQARRAQSQLEFPDTPALPFCFAFALTFGLSFALAFLGVDMFGRFSAFGALGGVGGLASLFSCAAGVLLAEGPDSGDSSGDDSSASSSSRASSSSTASSGSAGSAPAAPFLDPELRTLFLPPPGWILPRRVPREPANWNRALVTLANVEALYATRAWRYLAQAAEALLFAPGDAAFQSTHELFVQGAAWQRWRTARNSRRSHAGNHLNSLLQLVVGLFQQGLADMDLLLDPMMLHFPPAHMSIRRWYTGFQHATLQAALDDIDAQEPWRRFYRTPLTVAEMEANVRCRVTRDHPTFHVSHLAGKFAQQV